jgi:flagellar motor switch protein FliG
MPSTETILEPTSLPTLLSYLPASLLSYLLAYLPGECSPPCERSIVTFFSIVSYSVLTSSWNLLSHLEGSRRKLVHYRTL